MGGGRSKWFATKRGVQQGSSLSPLLFITLMDTIMKEIKEAKFEDLNAFVFADDIAIWGETEMEVQRRLDYWNTKFKEFKLTVSKSKSVAMKMSRTPTPCNIILEGQRIECVKSFSYLGSVISSDGSAKLEVLNRVAKGSSFFHQVRNLIWDKGVPLRAKQTMYKMYLLPIMTYSLETCVINKREGSQIQACEMKFLRSALQKTRRDRVRNEYVRRDLHVTLTMEERMSAARLKWLGHVKRMHPTRTPHHYLEMEVPGRRPIGRPRKRWTDQVNEDLKRRGVTWDAVEREKLYQDRNQWRHIVHKVPTRLAGRKP